MANSLKLEVLFNGAGNLPAYIEQIIGGTNHLSKNLKTAQGELKKLEFDQRQISKYREYREELNKTSDSLNKQKQIVSDLKAKADLGPLTAKQTKELAKAEKEVTKLNTAYEQQSAKLRTTTQDLNKAGISVDKLSQDESNLKDKILQTNMEIQNRKKALDAAQKAQAQYQKTQDMLNKGQEMAKKGLMVAGAGAATLVVPAKLSIDFESSMADIAKVVDGLKDDAGKVTPAYAAMSKEIINMSARLPMAATDIATIVAAGGQSGIAANELTQFAESAVKMGVAFDITADEAGQAMAEMRTAFRMSQTEVVNLSDKINYLGNNTPAAAKGIMDIVKRVGPLGEVSGFASGSIAALGATLRGMGIQEEVAATGIQNMMLALVAGESATKSQHNAFVALGMDAKQISKDMQADAEKTTMKVLQAVSKLPKDQQAAMLQSLFGKESIKAIAPLLTNMDALTENFHKVGDASQYAGSMEKEYAARASTTANNLQLLKNKAAAVAITIGNNLLPMINSGVDAIGGIITKVQTWADANPALANTLTKVAVGGIAVVGGISALALVVTTVLGPIAFLKMTLLTLGGGAGMAAGALKLLITPLKLLGTTFLWLGKAMLANPMILAITAIVAVVAGAAYLIYKNWEPIKGFFSQLWAGIGQAFSTAIGFIKSVFQSIDTIFANNPILTFLMPFIGIPRLIIANWSSITAFMSDLWAGITNIIGMAWATIQAILAPVATWLISIFEAIKAPILAVWDSVANMAGIAWEAIKTVFTPVGNWFTARWTDIKTAFSGGIAGISALILNWSPIGLFYQAFAAVLSWFGIDLPAKFTGFGKMIIDGLVSGINAGFDKLKQVWNKVNSYMPDFMKKEMDIHSPSRVMQGMGGHIMSGLNLGIQQGQSPLEKQFSKTPDSIIKQIANTQTTIAKDSSAYYPENSPIKAAYGANTATQPIQPMSRNNSRSVSVISQDTNEYHITVTGNAPVQQIISALEAHDRQKQQAMQRSFKTYRDQE